MGVMADLSGKSEEPLPSVQPAPPPPPPPVLDRDALLLEVGRIAKRMALASENRFVPIFDTFDSFVDENAIAVNDKEYGTLQGGETSWSGARMARSGWSRRS